jgi:hypothetical protein
MHAPARRSHVASASPEMTRRRVRTCPTWIRAVIPGALLASIGAIAIVGVEYYSDFKVRQAQAAAPFVHDEDDLDNAGTIYVARFVGMGITAFGLGVAGVSAGLAILLRAK